MSHNLRSTYWACSLIAISLVPNNGLAQITWINPSNAEELLEPLRRINPNAFREAPLPSGEAENLQALLSFLPPIGRCYECQPFDPAYVPQEVRDTATAMQTTNFAARSFDAYLGSKEAKECTAAIAVYIRRRSQFATYASSCGVRDVSVLEQSDSRLTPHVRRLGVLKEDDSIICTGYLLSNSSLITAHHCLKQVSSLSRYSFHPYAPGIAPIMDMTVRTTACNDVHLTSAPVVFQACDVVVLQFARRDDLALDAITPISEIKPFDRIQVLGYHIDRHDDEKFIHKVSNPDWRAGVVGSDNPMCIVHKTNDILIANIPSKPAATSKCIAHGCQTTGGMSGSPILLETDSGYAFAGVHIGSTDRYSPHWNDSNSCNLDLSIGVPLMNLGVVYE